MTISRALYQGFVSLLHPRMLGLMVVPVMVALVLWLFAAVIFWSDTVAWIEGHIQNWQTVQWLLGHWPMSLIAAHAGTALLALSLIPLILVTVVLLTGVFAMPIMVAHLGARDYGHLHKRHGGSFFASAWNGLRALAMFVLLAVLTLPLWLFPPLWPALSLGLLGFLNQQVFAYDALSEHASAAEIRRILREDRWPLLGLGMVVALAAHVPLLGFFAPIYGGLVFIHYTLGRLGEYRLETPTALSGHDLEQGSRA